MEEINNNQEQQELTEEEINLVFDVYLKGAVIASKLVMEEMAKNYGKNDKNR